MQENQENQKEDGRDLYFRTIHEISPRVANYILKEIDSLNLRSGELREVIEGLPKKRQGKPLMRPNLTGLIYRNLGGEMPMDELVPALSVSELSTYQAYLDNWIFDNKRDALSDRKTLNLIVAGGEVLRDLTQKTIDGLNVGAEERKKISLALANANIGCYDAQAMNFTADISQAGKLGEEEFLNDYLERSRMLSGLLYGFSTELGAIIVGANEGMVSVARNLGETLGTGFQATNDIADFVTDISGQTDLKDARDQLADIKGGRLTLPIYHTLNSGSEEERESLLSLVGNEDASSIELMKASEAFISSGSFDKCLEVLRDYRIKTRKIVKELPKNSWRGAISSTAGTIRWNKYISYLTNLKKGVENGKSNLS